MADAADNELREKWRRISAIFAAAQPLPAVERDVFLKVACADHPEDLLEVRSLLGHHDSDSTFLDQADPLGAAVEHGPGLFRPDQQVGKYRVHSRLTTPGGQGVLYLAEDNLQRRVVLKILLPAFAADPRQRERLEREALAMARLTHPSIATVYAFDECNGVPFLVTEYVKGRNLRERLEAEGPYDPTELLDLACSITDALCAAHGQNVIHRDLKPENIMLPETGGVKLIDFGIARLQDSTTHATLTGTGHVIGTLAYMSPEQIEGSHVDHRSDVFSLGVVLYEAATNSNPFLGHTTETTLTNILRLDPPPLASRRPLAFGELEQIIARCLRKAPAARYQCASDLLDALRSAREAATRPTTVSQPGPPLARSPGVWWWCVHQVAVAVVQALLLIPLWVIRPHVAWTPGRTLVFIGPVALVALSVMVRMHSAFLAWTQRLRAGAGRRLVARRRLALLIIETLYAVVVGAAALLIIDTKPGIAALLLSFALGLLTALYVIEPVTTQDAFGDDDQRDS